MIDFNQVLNGEQCRAATAAPGPLLVLAAAGTGKTRTLVHRVAYLVEQGVPPERILLLTFTNRAAREMLLRASDLVPGMDGIWSGTFHHVCARFLRLYGEAIEIRKSFTILDEEDQKKLMGQCIKEHVKNVKDFPKKEVLLKIISDAANREWDLDALIRSYESKIALDVPLTMTVCHAYQDHKKELNALDFDDLLVEGLRLLRESARVRTFLQEHFLHVLVDEYQDTNVLQAKFTDILAAKHRNIMVVGDDFQCIYTWRGAKFENIMDFPRRWDGCKILKLEENYRSYAPILDVANTIMRDVPNQFEKTLRPFRTGEAVKPRLYHVYDGYAQAEAILKLVQHLHTDGVSYQDIAILYRAHYTSIDIQMALTRHHIPYQITSGVGVFEQIHVKDVLAFARICVDDQAFLAFVRVMSLLPGVGETLARRYWAKLNQQFNPHDPAQRDALDKLITPKAQALWKELEGVLARMKDYLEEGKDSLIIQDFVTYFYRPHLYRTFDPEDADGRLEDLNEISSQISSVKGGIRAFLDEVALMTNLDVRAKSSLPKDHMTLTTVHQAKGMEWPVVILPWLADTVFPSKRAKEEGHLDEERRLFYVAVTRARDRLYMLEPKIRRQADGGFFPVDPSEFVEEIPKHLLKEQTLYSSNHGAGAEEDAVDVVQPVWKRRMAPSKPVYKSSWRR